VVWLLWLLRLTSFLLFALLLCLLLLNKEKKKDLFAHTRGAAQAEKPKPPKKHSVAQLGGEVGLAVELQRTTTQFN
jgi:hypothetical protein